MSMSQKLEWNAKSVDNMCLLPMGESLLMLAGKTLAFFGFSWKTVLFIYCLSFLEPNDTESFHLGDPPT